MKIALLTLGLLLNFSVAQAADGLTLLHPEETYVVPGSVSSCSDIRGGTVPFPTSVTSDFFKLWHFRMLWLGEGQLIPLIIRVSAADSRIEGGSFICETSGALLEDMFGGSVFEKGVIDMNDPANGVACSLVCGGIKRTASAQNTAFTALANIEFLGYSQDHTTEKLSEVRAKTQVKLRFF